MADFDIRDGVLVLYDGPGGDVTVPDGVRGIGPRAFRQYLLMESLTLPAGLEYIAEDAFLYCTELVSVTFGPGLRKIDGMAFSDCYALRELVLPEGTEILGPRAFSCCDALETLRLPASLREIGRGCFAECRGLRSVSLPEGLKTIGREAFAGCVELEHIELPEGLETIPDSCFDHCGNLRDLRFPERLTTIGGRAFERCIGLAALRFPASLKTVGRNAFRNCGELDLVFEGSPTSADHAFGGCGCCVTVPSWTPAFSHLFEREEVRAVETEDFGSLPEYYKQLVTLRFVQRREPDPEREREITAWLRAAGAAIARTALLHPELLRWMCVRLLIAPEETEAWLGEAERRGDVEAAARILRAVSARRQAEAAEPEEP